MTVREASRCAWCDIAFAPRRNGRAQLYCDVCRWLDRRREAAYDIRIVRNLRYEMHGLTGRQYAALITKQRGRCAICKRGDRRLVIDHDHACCPGGESCGSCVRGLLCYGCNTAIGGLRGNVQVLRSALAYIEAGGLVRRPRPDSTAAERQRRHRAHRRGNHSLCSASRGCDQ